MTRTVKTTLGARAFDALDQEAGRRGCSIAELLRECIDIGLASIRTQRMVALSLAGDRPYRMPRRRIVVTATGAWVKG